MKCLRFFLGSLSGVLLIASAALGDIIPAGMRTDWAGHRPGVIGGIPYVTNIYVTLDTNATAATINSAIAHCPSNHVVLLSAGTYDLTGPLVIGQSGAVPSGQVSGVVLRGAGTGATTLNFHNCPGNFGTISFLPATFATGPNNTYVVNWLGGYAQGSTVISLDRVPSTLTPGTLLTLDQQDATNLAALATSFVNPVGISSTQVNFCRGGDDPVGNPQRIRSQVQTVRVVSISGTNVTIDPPIYMTNWSSALLPQATWEPNPLLMCGIEDMKLFNGYVGSSFPNTVLFQNCYNCWARNIETSYSQYAAVNLLGVSHCEIRDSFFHDCASLGGSVSYGINPSYGTSDCLVENNIFNAITAPILVDQGASGNVFSYNYMTNMIYPGINLSEGSETTHGAHPSMNLFEGNYGTVIGHDFIHGSSSHNTHFRERMLGYEPSKLSYTYAVSVQGVNWYESFVGCVFGTAGFDKAYEFNPQNPPNIYPPAAIYWMGVNSIGGGPTDGTMIASKTALRHGNYDVVNNGIVWDPTISDRTIPNSLYLAGKPSWFGDRPWPPFDPANPSAAVVTNLPAGYRFVFGKWPPGATNSFGSGSSGSTGPSGSTGDSGGSNTNTDTTGGGSITNNPPTGTNSTNIVLPPPTNLHLVK